MNKLVRKNAAALFLVLLLGISFGKGGSMSQVNAEPPPEADYILGRPMTEQEIAAQKELEPQVPGGYLDSGIQIPSIYPNNYINGTGGVLPEQYDARADGRVTPVKNQGSFNTCWAFSTIAASETTLISQGKTVNGEVADNTLDLSELHLGYFSYFPVDDPLGNAQNDSVMVQGNNNLMPGGNDYMATFALSRWTGVANESTAPYSKAGSALESGIARDNAMHLKNAYFISMADMDAIKEEIMKYGAVSAGYHNDSKYYNYSTGGYYCGVVPAVWNGHAITIVGWDDSYQAANFNTNPGSNGAWLVKNSWGEGWGKDGYFWISYQDVNLNKDTGTVYEYDTTDNYDHNYYYDGTTYSGYIQVAGEASIANVFTASGNQAGGNENLTAAAFAVQTPNLTYSLQIYKNGNGKNPESGTPMLSKEQKGTLTYAGYYTIPLMQQIQLTQGDTFAVVVHLKPQAGGKVGIFIDKSVSGSVTFYNETKPGESYLNMGYSWLDLDSKKMTARVKAFTNDGAAVEAVAVENITLRNDNIELTAGQSKALTAEVTPANATKKGLEWTSQNQAVASVKDGLVTAHQAGTTTIKATATDGSGKFAVCTITVQKAVQKPVAIPVTKVILALSKKNLIVGQRYTPTVTILPKTATNPGVVLSTKNTDIVSIKGAAIIAKKAGTAVVTVRAADGSGSYAVCQVNVAYPIKYKVNGGKNSALNPSNYNQQKITFKSPTRAGYSFRGWYTDSRYKNKITYIKKGTKKSYTLYAKWQKVTVKPPRITSLKSGGSKKAVLKYKKDAGAGGYEIWYGTSAKFTKGSYKKISTKATGVTLKNLKKGKTYYVKIRAYAKDSTGKQINSKYSTIKKIKIIK